MSKVITPKHFAEFLEGKELALADIELENGEENGIDDKKFLPRLSFGTTLLNSSISSFLSIDSPTKKILARLNLELCGE